MAPPAASDPHRQRALGSWYTPAWLVDLALDLALGRADGDGDSDGGRDDGGRDARRDEVASRPLRVLDPACGDGRFLAAVAARRSDATLVGVDVDPDAVASTRAALGPRATVVHADALTRDWGDERYDLIVGNPPFLNQLALVTTRGGRSALGGGPYADTAAVFLALACRVAAPGGRVVLVLPRSILATRDTEAIRTEVLSHAALDAVWIAEEPAFDAEVLTIVAAFTLGATAGAVSRWVGEPPRRATDVDGRALAGAATWSALVADLDGAPVELVAGVSGAGSTLSTVASITADFRDQFYGLIGAVGDHVHGPRFVTSGAIALGRCAWGERAIRFAGARYLAPRVDLTQLTPRLAGWAECRLVPKVLVAAQTSVLEACVDPDGTVVPGVPVLTVEPLLGTDPWLVCAAVCSPISSLWAVARFAGAGRSGSALKVSARQLADLPLPDRSWDATIDPLSRGDLEAYGTTILGCYDGLDADEHQRVLDWWLPLARKALR